MKAEPPRSGNGSAPSERPEPADLPEPPEPRLRRRPRSADAQAGDDRAGGLLLVHAHPDDESFSTGGLIARSIAEGRRVDLVTCTGGEEGEIHDPDRDPGEARPRLRGIRREELARAAPLRGTDKPALPLPGHHDSGR